MSQKSNDLVSFWQELKRRKVIRITTVYSAAAFIVLQLIDIIAQPLQLPDWTLTLVIVLLCIGFIFSVILSWIYDITPSGVKKTKPSVEVKQKNQQGPVTSTGWKFATYTSAVIVIILLAFNIFGRKRSETLTKLEKSIAILPFINDSSNDSTTYFIDGVMDEILANLQAIKELRVISRTSVEQFRGPAKPAIPEIAEKLGVNYIVEGSGQKYGNKIRLRVQLIRADKESHLWAKSYEKEIKDANDIFSLQSQIAQAIAIELEAVITPQEKEIIDKIPTSNLAAYEAYLQGIFNWRKFTQRDAEIALTYFELAIEKDPQFAPAYAGICNVWEFRESFSFVSPAVATPRAIAALEKALQLDSTRAEVYYALSNIKYRINWDWKGGEISIKKAISLNPNYADAYSNYSNFLIIVGRTKEAKEQVELALKLDPLNPLSKANNGMVQFFSRRYEDAIATFKDVLKMDPANVLALGNLPAALHQIGKYDDELEAWKSYYITVFKDFVHVFDQGYARDGYAGALNLEADTLVEQSKIKYINPFEIALIYACAGNKKRAMDLLKNAYDVHDPNMPYLLNPVLDSLRNDHLFQELCRKIDLPYELIE